MTLIQPSNPKAPVLYSRDDVYSHRARIIAAEKGLDIGTRPPQDSGEYCYTVPSLIDGDMVIYPSQVIMEYLEDRYPYPPLMPGEIDSRTHIRILLYRIETEWYSYIPDLESPNPGTQQSAREGLRESLTGADEVFKARPYFLSDQFTLADASLAALLWRLPKWQIDIGEAAPAVAAYARKLFARKGVRASLTPEEAAWMELAG